MVPRNGLITGEDGVTRCWWPGDDPLYQGYHDTEWARPVRDDRRLFEKLCLEGFQSGLSWLIILRKRENFRAAFADFDFHAVARFTARDVTRLLADAGIVRHRSKIESTINNARRAGEIEAEFGSLASYLWRFEPAETDRPKRMTLGRLQKMSTTPTSVALSKDLRRRGWTYVGPTTVYAMMQAVGMVNDHIEGCDARAAAEAARATFKRPAAARVTGRTMPLLPSGKR